MYWKVKLRPADTLFSKYIRTKAGNKCEYCGVSGEYKRLECSHYFSRRYESLRFDEDNCSCLCFVCHKELGHTGREEKEEYKKFMINKLGQKGFDLLELHKETSQKRDDKLQMVILREKMKELNEIY